MAADLFSLKGRTAQMTGGSRSIGKMIATGFVARGQGLYLLAEGDRVRCDRLRTVGWAALVFSLRGVWRRGSSTTISARGSDLPGLQGG
jgi:NAD(P)-dependent dehydrogenase (short-subunit alcohol dehydrogenase family)